MASSWAALPPQPNSDTGSLKFRNRDEIEESSDDDWWAAASAPVVVAGAGGSATPGPPVSAVSSRDRRRRGNCTAPPSTPLIFEREYHDTATNTRCGCALPQQGRRWLSVSHCLQRLRRPETLLAHDCCMHATRASDLPWHWIEPLSKGQAPSSTACQTV